MKLYNKLPAILIFSCGHHLKDSLGFKLNEPSRWYKDSLDSNFESLIKKGYINPYIETRIEDDIIWTDFYGYLAPDFQI